MFTLNDADACKGMLILDGNLLTIWLQLLQDDAIVNVIQLSEIKIFAPLSRLETGTQVSDVIVSDLNSWYQAFYIQSRLFQFYKFSKLNNWKWIALLILFMYNK